MSKITTINKLTITIECETPEDIRALYLLGNLSGVKRKGLTCDASTTVDEVVFNNILDGLYDATKDHVKRG